MLYIVLSAVGSLGAFVIWYLNDLYGGRRYAEEAKARDAILTTHIPPPSLDGWPNFEQWLIAAFHGLDIPDDHKRALACLVKKFFDYWVSGARGSYDEIWITKSSIDQREKAHQAAIYALEVIASNTSTSPFLKDSSKFVYYRWAKDGPLPSGI